MSYSFSACHKARCRTQETEMSRAGDQFIFIIELSIPTTMYVYSIHTSYLWASYLILQKVLEFLQSL